MAVNDKRPTIGLDLGTTNSCVTYTDALGELGKVSVATGNAPYDRVISSIVLDPLGKRAGGAVPILGMEAEQQRQQTRDTTYLEYFKNQLDSQRLKQRTLKHRLVATGQYNPVTMGNMHKLEPYWDESGGPYSREELIAGSGALLERLLQRAFADGADPDSRILVGIPVGYSGCARKRLVCALARVRDNQGEFVFDGYADVVRRTRFVLEPVAVAAAPGEDLDISGSENVLIFDHGGGTLDLSLIRYERRPEFFLPVAVEELAAGGSQEVAGRHFDAAFTERLLGEDEYRGRIEAELPDAFSRRQAIEECKRNLSTMHEARVPGADITVSRQMLEQAIKPHLDKIRDVVGDTLERGGVSETEVGWVVMTGGSSLLPAVKDTVMSLFSHASERDQVLRYFPEDFEGVESAITDVSEGLARYGQQNSLQRIVLWDVKIGREESNGFDPLFRRGEAFEETGGEAELVKDVEAPDIGRPGCSFGLYEEQLDYQFIFGLAEVPRLRAGSRLVVRLRRDSLFPNMEVRDAAGNVVCRDDSPSGWEQDMRVAADIERYPDNVLEEFFEEDHEYVPVVQPAQFRHAPLVRRLRVGDRVDWSGRKDGQTLTSISNSGEIKRIRPIGTDDSLPEMNTWDVTDFEFTIEVSRAHEVKLETRNGCIRLSLTG